MSKYKICCLTCAHNARDGRIFHKQAKSMAKAGHDVTLIAPHDKDELVDGVRVVAVPAAKNKFERLLTSWRILGKAFKEKAEVYHFHDPDLIFVGLVLKFYGAKIVYDVHEDYPASIRTRTGLPSVVKNILAGIFDVFEKTGYRFFDAVVAATDHISERFRSDKVVTLHNYPILDHATNGASPVSSNGHHTVVYAGLLSKVRGIMEMIQSIEYIDSNLQVRLRLLGMFLDPDFEKEVKSMKEFSEVDFLGRVPFEEVNSYITAADIGLVLFLPAPNHTESMPNKIFEYMLAGLPVVASNFPLWKEIIEGNNCGLTADPQSPQEIAATIEHLLRNPELVEEMGRNGKKAVLEKYNWERESEKLLELYYRLSSCKRVTSTHERITTCQLR